MNKFEDIIEKYRKELIDFSKQSPIHNDKVMTQEREVASVMAQANPEPIPLPDSEFDQPEAVVRGTVPFDNYDEFMDKNRSRGVLRVQAYSADRTFPVPNALARVYINLADGERELFQGVTDVDGIIDDISLPAPDSSISLDENSTVAPFATYVLRVSKPGYSAAIFNGIPVFDSVKSIQPVEMIPLSADGSQPIQTVVPQEPISLFGGEN